VSSIDLDNLWDLSGRVAIVTGASSGFGDRFSRVLAAAGCQVVAAARRLERLEALASDVPAVLPVRTDVADDAACRALVDTALERFGRIDVLVNNAGLSDAPDRAEEEDPRRFREVVEVNLNAPFVLSGMVAPSMISSGRGGSIINTASIQSFDPSASLIAYASTKAAIASFTRSLANLAIENGVRVNAVAPGPVWTPLIPSTMSPEKVKNFGSHTAFKRPAQPAELAPIYVFLASADASYVTGEIYGATGGQTPI